MKGTIFPDNCEEYHEYEDGIELFKKYYESGAEEEKIKKIINNFKSHKMEYFKEDDEYGIEKFKERRRYITICKVCKEDVIHSRVLDGVIIDKEKFESIFKRFSLSCEEKVEKYKIGIKNDLYHRLKSIYEKYSDIGAEELCKIIQEEATNTLNLITIENIIK